MKIQTSVITFVACFICLSLAIGISSFYESNRLHDILSANNTATSLIKVMNIRFSLVQNYINTGKTEYLIQLDNSNIESDKVIQDNIATNSKESKVILDQIIHDNDKLKEISLSLSSTQNTNSSNDRLSPANQLKKSTLLHEFFRLGLSVKDKSYIIAKLNEQRTRNVISSSAFYTDISIFLLMTLSALFFALIIRRVIRPINQVNKSMINVIEGDLTHVIKTSRNDEIGQLASSFNQMTSKLNSKIHELDATILQLEKSNNDLKQFVYIASHDLQEPLRMISSYLQIIEKRNKGKIDKESDEFIDFAVKGAKRLQDMIDDLLIYSMIDELRNTPIPVNFNEALQESLENLKSTIAESHAVITRDDLPTIFTDKTHIIDLFQNLISNAIKFRSKQAPEIHVAASHNDHEWLFSISDNGMGIDPNYKENLFIAFKRLVGKEYPGTGIGLATCRKIVERHHGRIWVESEPGKGSTFYFTIPDA